MNPWSPTSPCGPSCLPAPEVLRGAARPRRLVRLTARGTALAVVLGAGLAAACLVPLLGAAATRSVQRGWVSAVLRVCGVRLRWTGPAAPPGALVVANHVSWLDVLALPAVAPVRMLAKTEVRQWPLLGAMAARAGTVFLDRDRLRDLPAAMAGLAAALRAGTVVGVFAEGTTRCGRDLGPFRPAAFQAAHDAGAPVVPVAVRYRRPATADGGDDPDPGPLDATAAFIGDDTLASSLMRVLAARGTVLDVATLPIIDASAVPAGPARASARRVLARTCAQTIADALPPDAGDHPAALPSVVLPATPDLEHVA